MSCTGRGCGAGAARRLYELSRARDRCGSLLRLRHLPLPKLRDGAPVHALLREPQGERRQPVCYEYSLANIDMYYNVNCHDTCTKICINSVPARLGKGQGAKEI